MQKTWIWLLVISAIAISTLIAVNETRASNQRKALNYLNRNFNQNLSQTQKKQMVGKVKQIILKNLPLFQIETFSGRASLRLEGDCDALYEREYEYIVTGDLDSLSDVQQSINNSCFTEPPPVYKGPGGLRA